MMSLPRLLAIVAELGFLFLLHADSLAGEKQKAYEQELIDRSLKSQNLVPDSNPIGKIIEDVIVIRHPIMEETDPWPGFLNDFHVVTREDIIRQELLFTIGQPYDEERISETARNLRSFPMVFSTVRLIATVGSASDRVKIVVITKDLWSIRVNSNFNFGGGALNYLSFMPMEQNFLGYNQQIGLLLQIDRDTYYLGQVYQVPRLFGSRWSLMESLGFSRNHRKDKLEGGTGTIYLDKPLYSVLSKWSFSLNGSFNVGTSRTYQGNHILQERFPDGISTWYVDRIYDYNRLEAQAKITRSFGLKWKTDLSFGYGIYSNSYKLNEDFPDVPISVEQDFVQDFLPVDDQAGTVFAVVGFYEASYSKFMNIRTYGLTEDYRFGPRASFKLGWSNPAFGFAQKSVNFNLDLGYQWLIRDNILSLGGAVSTRWQPGHDVEGAPTDWINQMAQLQLYNISPELFGLGRMCVRILYIYSQHSLSRTLYALGGNNTLRGFASNYLLGQRLFNVNVEFRSLPLVFHTMHFGFVAFYDGGSAYDFKPEKDFSYRQSVGFGIRGLFPQFDRGTVRLDIGIPLGSDFRSDRIIEWFTFAYLQAF